MEGYLLFRCLALADQLHQTSRIGLEELGNHLEKVDTKLGCFPLFLGFLEDGLECLI